MNSQLTPVVPPAFRRDRRDGPGRYHGVLGQREGYEREARRYLAAGGTRGTGEFVWFTFLCMQILCDELATNSRRPSRPST